MYSMYIMILTAAAACCLIAQVLAYLMLAALLILNVVLFLSEAKRDIECLCVLWI